MKTKILLCLFSVLCFWATGFAGETEPNNDRATANTLALNGSNSGAIDPAGEQDWWKVTTTGDGKIDVTLSPLSGRNTYVQLYDNDGTTLFTSQYSTGTFTISKDGLAIGTYYIRVYCYYNTDTSSYLISNTLTEPVQAADVEPNGLYTQAKTLPLNGSKTGHIGYYYNNYDDTTDWYKVTTNAEGQLNWTITVANGKNVYAQLYDINGTTFLGGNYTTGTATYSKNGLAVGVYYIKIFNYFISEFAPYTISNTLTPASVPNDAEPNGTRAQALNINPGDSAYGHIGYANFNGDDTTDFYKVTTTEDGRIDFTMSSLNGQNVYFQLFDNDGTTYLAGNYTSGTANYSKDGLAAGTYYLKIFNYSLGEFSPYQIKVNLVQPAQANDIEPNNSKAQALTLPLNGSVTGHSNYFYNNYKDTADWYKVTTYGDGRLRLTMASANGQNVWAYLYDNDGTTLLASAYTSGTAILVNKDGLAAGTYFIKVKTYYVNEWAPYTLSDSLFKPEQANDTEPNDTRAQALPLPLNGSVTGHANYYYNLLKDGEDWYQLNTNKDGMIGITIQSHNGQNVWAYLYDKDGITLIDSKYSTSTISYTVDGLSAGTYYIKVKTYYTSEWAPYTLSNTLTTYANTNDTEPNNYFSTAKIMLANDSTTGHVNFYYNGLVDDEDNWKINYTGVTNGSMTVVFSQENRLKFGDADPTYFRVYRDTAAAPVSTGYYYGTSGNIVLNNLIKGYYYIKVFTYYSGAFTHFSSYKIANTFTQDDIAQIALTNSTAATSCTDGVLTYSLSGANGPAAPYKVQLYRFGVAYGTPAIVSANTVTFNVPPGTYYATAFGDGASGSAFTTSSTTTFAVPKPKNPSTSNITAYEATLNWNSLSCTDYHKIQYHKQGESGWSSKTTNKKNNFVLKNLDRNTTYVWRVSANDSANGQTLSSPYSDSVTFTTLNDTARITLVVATPTNTCTGSSIKYVCTSSLAPYTVQLYRFGVAYGTALTVTDTALFSNLPPGRYYATAYGFGATGDNFGTSVTTNFAPPPTSGTYETGITKVKAVVHWTLVSCANGYILQYRKTGTNTWTQRLILVNRDSAIITGLTAATNYQWRVASAVGLDTFSRFVPSNFTVIDNFTTAALPVIASDGNQISTENSIGANNNGIVIMPNPAINSVRIIYSGLGTEIVSLQIKDFSGKNVLMRNNVTASSLNAPINVSALSSGIYLVNLITAEKKIISSKLIIEK